MEKNLDIHSQAQSVESIEQGWVVLAKKIILNPRDSKKWRLFMPTYDERYSLLEEFWPVKFIYNSVFFEQDNVAWNHYHHVKKEILIPLLWEFEIHLTDVKSKISTILEVAWPTWKDDEEVIWVYIPLWIAHKVISKAKNWVLQVLASNPSDLSDEIDYEI